MRKLLFVFAFLAFSLLKAQDGNYVIIIGDSIVASSNGLGVIGGGGSSAWGGITGTLSNQTDLVTELAKYGLIASNNTWTGVNSFSGTTTFNNDVTFSNPLAVNNIFTSTGAYAEINKLYFGKSDAPALRRWGLEVTAFGPSITLETAEDSGIFSTLYTFNSSGTPVNAEDVVTKSYVDNAASNATQADGTFGDVTVTSGDFNLNADSVGSSEIADGAVTTTEILDGTILSADLSGVSSPSQGDYLVIDGTGFGLQTGLPNNSVTAATISNGSVSEADLQISNSPFANAVLGFDGTDGFQWVTQSGGGGSFDTSSNYTLTGGWDFDGSAIFSEGITIDGPNSAEEWTVGGDALETLVFSQNNTVRYTMRASGTPLISTDVPTKQYIDDTVAALGNPNTNAGQKVFTTIDGTVTPTYSVNAGDFSPGGADEGKLAWIVVQDTVEFSLPEITSTTKSLIVKGELNAKAVFKATSGQLFWIANENSYVNAFEIDNMNAASITPVSSSLYSVEGNVQGFNDDSSGPSSVSNFQESNIQSNSVRLTWDHATDDVAVAYYEISTDGINFSNIGYVTQYDLLGLTPSTAYTVTVRAVDTANNQGASSTVNFTTSATFTLVTDSNANTNIFSSGAGSDVPNDTGLYDSGIGDHLAPVNVQSQSAVATTVNGYTHAHRVVSDGSAFSRVRPRFLGATTQGAVYEWDFLYRMTDGGQYGALNVDGTSVTGLSATDWTLISGESTAGGTSLDVEVYASNDAAASPGEAIEWILVVKEKEVVVDYTPLTGGNANPQIVVNGPGAFPPNEDTTDYNGTSGHNSAIAATLSVESNTDLGGLYVARVTATNNNGTSRARPIWTFPAQGTTTYQYDFTYRMVQGSHGRFRAKGFDLDITGLSATEWTTISGEFTSNSGDFDANVYAEGDGLGNVGDIIEWKLSVKQKE